MNQDYKNKVVSKVSPAVAFAALTTGIGNWWVEPDGSASQVGDTPTFRFGENFWKMKVTEVLPNEKVTWECIAANHIDSSLPAGADPEEWLGTKLIWEVSAGEDDTTVIRLTHEGLGPQLQCYKVCTVTGWDFFMKSLKQFLDTGTGTPFKSK